MGQDIPRELAAFAQAAGLADTGFFGTGFIDTVLVDTGQQANDDPRQAG
jgi:predicted DNA-binding protein with PD1-like motif